MKNLMNVLGLIKTKVDLERVTVISPLQLRMKVIDLLYNSDGDYIIPYLLDSIVIRNSDNTVIVTGSHSLYLTVLMCKSSREMVKSWVVIYK